MYRVLIVDDEEPVLDSYQFMIRNTEDFAVVGTARSGYEAHKLIYELEPDLVFMDINIPGMDGIQVISEVYRKFPDMIFILSTAYERFDLAQRAIPLGVFAYLVKPVSKRTFFATLDSVREHFAARPQNVPARREEEVLQDFFRKIIWRPMREDEWEQYRGRFSFSSDRGIVFLLELEQDAGKWCAAVEERLSLRHRSRYDTMLNRGLFLIFEDMDRETLDRRLQTILKEALPASLFYSYGLGSLHRGPELFLSCNEALEELRNKRNLTDILLRERLRLIQLRRKIGIADPEELRGIFKAFWEELFSTHDFAVAKAKMASAFVLLIDDATGAYSGHSETVPPFNPHEDIMAMNSIEEWEAWVPAAFTDVMELAARQRSGNFPLPLMKAIAYIHDRYTEGLQLSTAAEAAQVAPAYLSRLFSEQLNTTFSDYVTDLRVERAERLIRESSMSIKEIAHAVGYQDPNYFGKIFRKATGLPPTVYAAEKREAGREEGL